MKEREQAIYASGLLVVLLAITWQFLISPALSARQEFHQQAEDIQFQYGRFNTLVNQQQSITADLKTLQDLQLDPADFLEGSTPALAAANLQMYTNQLLQQAGGMLESSQVIRNEDSGIFPSATIRIQFRAGIDALQKFIHELESGQPKLYIDSVYLQSHTLSTTGRVNNSQLENPPELETRLDITGYVFGEITRGRP